MRPTSIRMRRPTFSRHSGLAALLAGLVVWAGVSTPAVSQPPETERESGDESESTRATAESESNEDESSDPESAEDEPADDSSPPPEGRAPVEEESPSTPGYDTADIGDDQFLSLEHRRHLYREGRLNYGRAALWTALFPGLGNFYTEQYFLGGLFASLMGFAGFFLAYGLVTQQPGFNWAAAGIAGGSYVGGWTTTYVGVRNYNRRLRRSLRIEDASASLRPRPFRGVTIRFRF